MKRVFFTLAMVACTGRDPARDSAPSVLFVLGGSVSDPAAMHSGVRVIVGLAPPSNTTGTIRCADFLATSDRADQTLPSPYEFDVRDGLPIGNYTLVALLLPATGRAPYALYPVTLDTEGIHYHSPDSTSTIDIVIQGTVTYDCP